MIRILFLTSGLTHGGVNKSLLNMVSLIDRQKYSFDIFPVYREGPYNNLFDDYNVISADVVISVLFPFIAFLQRRFKRKVLYYKAFDLLTKLLIHIFPKRYAVKIGRFLTSKKYDVVLSYQEGYTTELATYVRAPKHIAWIHCDYSRYIEAKRTDESKIYDSYDSIVAVSDYTASVVRRYIPSAAEKVFAIHNLIDQNGMIEKSECKPDDDRFESSPYTLISVGRMDPVKRFSLIPRMANELKEKGVHFQWFIIGDGGSEKKKVENEIKKNKVENEVILLGAKDNPYPYIKNSTVLVCPSSSEACPNVVNEGRVLHIPVVVTDFPSANEFIEHGKNGFISSIDNISEVLCSLYSDKAVYNQILSNISDFRYDNEAIMHKIEELLDTCITELK